MLTAMPSGTLSRARRLLPSRPAGALRGRLWAQAATGFAAAMVALASGCGDRTRHPFFDRVGEAPVIFAHRGGGGLGPEATLPVLLAAHTDLHAVVEFDVHRSRDGRLVVIHDETVDRTTNGTGRVVDLDLASLQALDAGHCALPGQGDGTAAPALCREPTAAARFVFRGRGYRIPTLAEVLAALPAEAFLSIEAKGAGFEAELASALRTSGRLHRLVIGAEDDDVAARLKDRLPEAAHFHPRAAATCLALASKAAFGYSCPAYEVFASPLEGAGLRLDTAGMLSTAHRRGIAVVYWTVNDEATLERLFRLGADGVYTDYPDRARRVRDRLRGSGDAGPGRP